MQLLKRKGFAYKLIKASDENEIIPLATFLAYRLIFALFPFLIFLISLIGFFNIDSVFLMGRMGVALPDSIMEILNVFVTEVIDSKNSAVLSISFAVSIISAASGFRAVIKGINRSYGQEESRSFLILWAISIFLVLLLAVSIISSMLVLVFDDKIYEMIVGHFNIDGVLGFLFGLAGNIVVMVILLFTVIMVYKFGSCKKLTFRKVLPGSAITISVWFLISKAFNVYVNNFSKHSKVYGSIAGIIILMLWLNIISIVILTGAEINAILDNDLYGTS